MGTTYVKYTIEGEHSPEAAQRKLGDVAASGVIVRIDVDRGKTHIYIAEHRGAVSIR